MERTHPIIRLRLSLGLLNIAMNMLWGLSKGRKGELSPAGVEIVYTSYFSQMRMSDVAEMLGVSRSTATDLVDYLERENYVSRIQGEDDRRTVSIRPTEKGEEWVLSVEELLFGFIESRFFRLSGAEQEEFARLAAKFSGVSDNETLLEEISGLKQDLHPRMVPLKSRENGRLRRLEDVTSQRYGPHPPAESSVIFR